MAESTTVLGKHSELGRQAGETRPRRLRFLLMIVIPILAVLAGGWWYLTGGRYISTDDAYVQADKLSVSTDVSGIVASVDVHDNQSVTAGQVLFRLDAQPFRIALAKAEAQLGLARNSVEAMKAQYRQQQQEIHTAQITVDYQTREFGRRSALFRGHVVAADQLDKAQHDLDLARQQLAEDQQQLAGTVANLGGDPDIATDSHPQVLSAQAALDQAKRDFDHCTVRAPADGIVSNVPSLRPGMYLPAASPAFSLVSVADAWIEANPKESQLTWVRPGQPVTVTVDTYPGVTWQGTLTSLSPASGSVFSVLPAQNTSGNWVKVVQRIPIRVAVIHDDGKPELRAGMSAVIEIDTGHKRELPGFLAGLFGHGS
jgi:membrane fusion protein (multidrug efflux system)